MIKRGFSIILFVLLILILPYCQIGTVDNEDSEFESGFYYYGNAKKIPIYRSNLIISVKFDSTLNTQEAEQLANQFGLSLFKDFYNHFYSNLPDWHQLLKNRYVIMSLPRDDNLNNFITYYPKKDNESYFGSHPTVEFSMPTYSSDNSGNLFSRLFIGDEFVAKSDSDSAIVHEFCSSHAVSLIKRNQSGVYLFRITKESQQGTLDMANDFFENELFVWSLPDFIAMIIEENEF